MDQDRCAPPIETIGLGRDRDRGWSPRATHRHSGRLITALAVLVVAIGAYTLVSEDTKTQSDIEPSAHPVHHRHSPSQTTLRSHHSRGSKLIRYAGVTVLVPDYWGRDRVTECGGLLSDTVIYPGRTPIACDLAHGCCPMSKLQHSSVQFIDTTQRSRLAVTGRDALDRGPVHQSGGGYVSHIDVFDRQVRVVVRSPYRPLVERLAASLRVTNPRSSNG